jgi:hypothetical protein
MCVFALASRYTDDPRVLLDEPIELPLNEHPEPFQWQTAGFKYYFSIMGQFMQLYTSFVIELNVSQKLRTKKAPC